MSCLDWWWSLVSCHVSFVPPPRWKFRSSSQGLGFAVVGGLVPLLVVLVSLGFGGGLSLGAGLLGDGCSRSR